MPLWHAPGGPGGWAQAMLAGRARRVDVQAQPHALRALLAHGARDGVLARPVCRHLQPQRRHIRPPREQAAGSEFAARLPLHPHVMELRVVGKHLRSRTGQAPVTAASEAASAQGPVPGRRGALSRPAPPARPPPEAAACACEPSARPERLWRRDL